MKYMGSKNRIAKHLLPIILKGRKEGQWYVEPFVGGCNMIDKVGGDRIGADSNLYVITLFQGLQEGMTPPDKVSEEEYAVARDLLEVNFRTAFIGFGCSYSGKWFGGYARGNTSYGVPRNYCLESKNNILKQREGLEGVQLYHKEYHRLAIPPDSLIYCDPPYKGATQYKGGLNYEDFYQWCREKKAEGHTIFISEYWMPEDFTCVWAKEQTSSLTQNTGAKRAIERLYTL